MPALRRAAPALLAVAWIALLFAPLARPDRALANRDVALFHLPLRTAFARLLAWGMPTWNPWLNGGQPILSNPNYAAFYPPTWLALLLPPAQALNGLVILHAALAFAGAYRLVRHLGGERPAAALGALAWSGGGAALSLVSTLNFFCGMAWLPWIAAWTDAALRAESPPDRPDDRLSGRLRAALAAGLALGLQALSGEPAAVAISVLLVGCLAASSAGAALRRGRPASPLVGAAGAVAPAALVGLVALGIAAVQILPTWDRLAGTARAGGLPAAPAAVWSTPAERLAELAWPRFFGDPGRVQEGLYFGWHLNDRGYPYVPSIYPGLLLTILALAGLARWPIPRRGAWAAAALLGAALALGRHDPLYGVLRRVVPGLALFRYPEKFVLLPIAVVAVAGALGWQRLAAERRAGRYKEADFPLALALVAVATSAALATLLALRPRLAAWLVVTHGAPHASAAEVARGAAFLRAEGWAAVAGAAAVAALFALRRFTRLPERALGAAAVALLAADLWHYGHGLMQTVPAAAYQVPPPLARAILKRSGADPRVARTRGLAAIDRIYVEPAAADRPELVLRSGSPTISILRAQLARLEPYSGSLWGLSYALDEDYDLMLTGWARLALFVFHSEQRVPDLADRFLAAWNVGALVLRRPPAEWIPEAEKNGVPQPARLVRMGLILPRYRFPRRVSFHPSYASALAVARIDRYALDLRDHCVRPEGRPATVDYGSPAVLALDDRGGRLVLRYRAPSPAFFAFATTYDPGWRAEVDGIEQRVYLTAACQLGLELPAGEHELALRFHQPWLGAGAAISLATLALVALAGARLARPG
jgi:hypothetical protein